MPPAPKICASCGRSVEWRKKWERNWDEVRFCSTACRRRGLTPLDHALEREIIDLLGRRSVGATICPSDAARAVADRRPQDSGASGSGEPWRELMEPARRAARRLVAAGEVVITQAGTVVDPSTAKGAIRIRRFR